jgi:hypothetical protein
MKPIAIVTSRAILFSSPAAHALCSYNGVDNAKTTIAQEFKDSKWVVKAKVVSAKDHFPDEDQPWTLYQLEVQHAYKGQPPRQLKFFTFRNSGAFYMDKAWVALPAGHDIGGEYLLFLNPLEPASDQPKVAKGAVFVNYSCGVSGPWKDVSEASQKQVLSLER